MTQLYKINVKLSPNQKKNLAQAFHKREIIVLRLSKDSLSGNDTLHVPSSIAKRLERNRRMNKGMDIKLAKTNIRKQVGGSLLTSILSLGRKFAPAIGKTLGLSALAGPASEGASQIVKKISGRRQIGGYLIEPMNINRYVPHLHLFDNKQQGNILNAMQNAQRLIVRPTKKGGAILSTLLASVGILLAIEAIKKLTGRGAPRMGNYNPPKGKTGYGAPRIGLR